MGRWTIANRVGQASTKQSFPIRYDYCVVPTAKKLNTSTPVSRSNTGTRAGISSPMPLPPKLRKEAFFLSPFLPSKSSAPAQISPCISHCSSTTSSCNPRPCTIATFTSGEGKEKGEPLGQDMLCRHPVLGRASSSWQLTLIDAHHRS